MGDETTYRVYGSTQALGDAKGDKPKPGHGPCEETLAVSLSPQPEKGVILAAGDIASNLTSTLLLLQFLQRFLRCLRVLAVRLQF